MKTSKMHLESEFFMFRFCNFEKFFSKIYILLYLLFLVFSFGSVSQTNVDQIKEQLQTSWIKAYEQGFLYFFNQNL